MIFVGISIITIIIMRAGHKGKMRRKKGWRYSSALPFVIAANLDSFLTMDHNAIRQTAQCAMHALPIIASHKITNTKYKYSLYIQPLYKVLRNQPENMHNGNHVRIVVDNTSDDGCQLLTYLYCQHISTPFPTQNLCHAYALNNTALVIYWFWGAQY